MVQNSDIIKKKAYLKLAVKGFFSIFSDFQALTEKSHGVLTEKQPEEGVHTRTTVYEACPRELGVHNQLNVLSGNTIHIVYRTITSNIKLPVYTIPAFY